MACISQTKQVRNNRVSLNNQFKSRKTDYSGLCSAIYTVTKREKDLQKSCY